ncbi:hypothetical protein [Streptomyces sp. NPDC058308]|uniref:hypothetical protein n=1 Tax=Streptomyces sp. NPDC058308 TaxID=3346440 RepID=UPI0036F02757
MNTRLTRGLASVTFALAVLAGLVFAGTAVTHMLDDGAVCVETSFWQNAALRDDLPIAEGVQASGSAERLCQDHPSAGQAGPPPPRGGTRLGGSGPPPSEI